MRMKTLIPIILMAVVLMTPCCDRSDGASAGDINWNTVDSLEINADSHKVFTIHIYNLNTEDMIHVRLSVDVNGHADIRLDRGEFVLTPYGESGDRADVKATLMSDKYVDYEETEAILTLETYNMADGALNASTISVPLVINSAYGNSSSINRILGLFDNPLPEPLDGAITAGAITLILWIIISALTSSFVRIGSETCINRIVKIDSNKDLINKEDFRKTWKYVFGIVIMYGIANTMIVIGVRDAIIVRYMDVTTTLTILFVAMTFWHINTALANLISYKLSKGDTESSLKPLMVLLGRSAILLLTIAAVLSIYGIDLGSIVVAFGLGATGISMGAKTVITQFFCGVRNMVARTFRTGDKIRIGTDKTTLKIRKVGVMTTECKNWSNEEIYYIPNSTLADMRIVNITKDNVFYKVYDYIPISYTSSIDRAREIMVHCAYEDDGVVSDGSYPMPDVRFSDVNRNGIILRLAYTVMDHEDYGSISARIRKRIYEEFVKEGIEIPYIQYSVRLVGTEDKPAGV